MDFSVNPLKFFIFNPICPLKVIKFLIKISQFKFLVMTEKNIFANKLFLALNISDFSVFLCKNCTPSPTPKKVTPLSQQPFSRNWDPVKPSLFKIWWRGCGGGAHYVKFQEKAKKDKSRCVFGNLANNSTFTTVVNSTYPLTILVKKAPL